MSSTGMTAAEIFKTALARARKMATREAYLEASRWAAEAAREAPFGEARENYWAQSDELLAMAGTLLKREEKKESHARPAVRRSSR
jgi:hypothetical protein